MNDEPKEKSGNCNLIFCDDPYRPGQKLRLTCDAKVCDHIFSKHVAAENEPWSDVLGDALVADIREAGAEAVTGNAGRVAWQKICDLVGEAIGKPLLLFSRLDGAERICIRAITRQGVVAYFNGTCKLGLKLNSAYFAWSIALLPREWRWRRAVFWHIRTFGKALPGIGAVSPSASHKALAPDGSGERKLWDHIVFVSEHNWGFRIVNGVLAWRDGWDAYVTPEPDRLPVARLGPSSYWNRLPYQRGGL